MRSKTPALIFGVLVLFPLALPAQQDLTQLVLGAPLIFRGTIVSTESPTLPLSPKGRVVRVLVEEIFRGAATVGDFTREEIVVVRVSSSDRKTGVFFVRPIAYGKTLAAEEIGEIDPPSDSKEFALRIARIEQQDADDKLQERLRTADAVIVGRVLAIRSLRDVRGGGPSEHDPDWAIAQVLVLRTLKGQPRTRDCARGVCVEVAFAQSDDIRWFRAPKLIVGHEDIFLLRPPDPKLLREREAPPAPYAVIDMEDVRPVSEEGRVRELLRRTQ